MKNWSSETISIEILKQNVIVNRIKNFFKMNEEGFAAEFNINLSSKIFWYCGKRMRA